MRMLCLLVSLSGFLTACAAPPVTVEVEVTRVVERIVEVEVTRIVEVTPAGPSIPDEATIKVDLTRRMIFDPGGGYLWLVAHVDEIEEVSVREQSRDGNVLHVETDLKLTDRKGGHYTCATTLTYLLKDGLWTLSEAVCPQLIMP